MKATTNSVVSMHYTLKNETGMVLDSSVGKDPMVYLHGMGVIIPGLEKAIENRIATDQFNVKIATNDAYGEIRDELIQVVPLSGFKSEGEEQLQEGMQVQVESNQGPSIALVSKIEGEDVTLDLNHPLAGMDLEFDIEIVSVRAATPEEIEHKHVHGEGGYQH